MQMSQVKLCAARVRVIYELLQQYPIHTHSLKLGRDAISLTVRYV